MKQRVRGGTPDHGENLCMTCESATWRRGHRVSEEQIFCHALSDNPRPVPFQVAECSSYRDKRMGRTDGFYRTAWMLIPDVGFIPPDEVRRRQQKGEWAG